MKPPTDQTNPAQQAAATRPEEAVNERRRMAAMFAIPFVLLTLVLAFVALFGRADTPPNEASAPATATTGSGG